MPGSTSRRAPPSAAATSTRPSKTRTDAPPRSTVTLNTVPLTRAASIGVWTPKWGVDFFSIRYSALPRSWINWMMPLRAAATPGSRNWVRGETITYSRPRTSTARPSAPVAIASPGASVPPRSAGLDCPACLTCTDPATSLIRQAGTAACAIGPNSNAATMQSRPRKRIMGPPFRSGPLDQADFHSPDRRAIINAISPGMTTGRLRVARPSRPGAMLVRRN
jgi:hypothetical protein